MNDRAFIKSCGGARIVADWLKISESSIHRWFFRAGRQRGGIPAHRRSQMILQAQRHGIAVPAALLTEQGEPVEADLRIDELADGFIVRHLVAGVEISRSFLPAHEAAKFGAELVEQATRQAFRSRVA
jgi:hypothetical protein